MIQYLLITTSSTRIFLLFSKKLCFLCKLRTITLLESTMKFHIHDIYVSSAYELIFVKRTIKVFSATSFYCKYQLRNVCLLAACIPSFFLPKIERIELSIREAMCNLRIWNASKILLIMRFYKKNLLYCVNERVVL